MFSNNNLDQLKEEMVTKSDAELNEYLLNTSKYSVSELSTAIAELKNRGKVFSDTEWKDLLSEIRLKLWGKNATFPSYFSKRTIYLFSFFFSVLYGSIILSMNLDNRREKYLIIGSGLTFIIAQFILVTMLPTYFWFHLGLHVLGCAVIPTLLWRKYMGTNDLYYKKPVELQILIGMASLTFILRAVHFCAGHQDFQAFYCMGKDLVYALR
jgi:hypothetical protein